MSDGTARASDSEHVGEGLQALCDGEVDDGSDGMLQLVVHGSGTGDSGVA